MNKKMFDPMEEQNGELLYEAIKKKDKESVQKLINSENININIPNGKGYPPLYWAITKFKNSDIMIILLDNGANIHATYQHNLKPLDVAIQNNKTEAASLLVERGALVGENFNSYLLKAIEQNDHQVVKVLIDNGMDFNPSTDFEVFFNAAISRRHPKIIEHFLPYCQFSRSFNKYIPRELVIKHESQNKECIELLLKWHFIVNPICNQDRDFIYAAVDKGYLPIVLQLLKLGINVNLVNLNTKLSLLKLACMRKHCEIVKSLLKHNARLNIAIPTDMRILNKYHSLDIHENSHSFSSVYDDKDLWDITYLHIATINSDLMMINHLLSKNSLMIDSQIFFDMACIAVQNNCLEIVCIFLDCNINVNGIDAEGKSLLHFCLNGHNNQQDFKFNIAKLLLDKGATDHLRTPGNSLVFEAIKNEHSRTAQLFLDYNANIEYIDPDTGDTPLHQAIKNNFSGDFIENLLKLNAPIDAVNGALFTPLLVACKTPLPNQLEIIKVLLRYNANVNYTIDHGNVNSLSSTLDLVQDIKEFTWLLEKRVNLNYSKTISGQTPLHLICKHKTDKTEIITKLLLKYKANIEAVDVGGWTPLFVACYSNNNVAVKCLLENNANFNHTDKQNLTALYISTKYNKYNYQVAKLLLEHKVNIQDIKKQCKSLIHVIAENGNAEIIENFACMRVNFHLVNGKGNTPLHTAIENKCIDVIDNLIKYGANINILNKQNQTPLRYALKYIPIFRNKLDYSRSGRDSNWNHRYLWSNSVKLGFSTYGHVSDLNTYKEIIRSLKKHIVKLKIAGLKVNKQNLQIVYSSDNYENYEFSNRDKTDCAINILKLEVKCEQEIEKMKFESVNCGNVTFADLLKKTIHILSRYVNNRNIQRALNSNVYDVKFPLYINIVRNRFQDAKIRYQLLHSAKKYFRLRVSRRLPEDCLDILLSYLNTTEIKKFIRALKPS